MSKSTATKFLSMVLCSSALASTLAIATFPSPISARQSQSEQPRLSNPSEVSHPSESVELAQFIQVAGDRQVITVTGQATASLPADSAMVRIYLGQTVDECFSPDPSPPVCPEVAPLTRQKIKPLIDALIANGFSESSLKIQLEKDGGSPYSFYNYIGFDVSQPNRDRLQTIFTALDNAAKTVDKLEIRDKQVVFKSNRCNELRQSAYNAAFANAQERATMLATTMKVQLGSSPSVSESVINGWYGLVAPETCSYVEPFTNSYSSYNPGISYSENMPIEVRLFRELYVVYPVK
jgi:uncharacterized protein YggE